MLPRFVCELPVNPVGMVGSRVNYPSVFPVPPQLSATGVTRFDFVQNTVERSEFVISGYAAARTDHQNPRHAQYQSGLGRHNCRSAFISPAFNAL